MASASETELVGLFEKCQKATSMRMALAKMGDSQSPTIVATDNTMAKSIVNGTEKQKNIHSNRHDILLGQIYNTKKSFPHILVREKGKPGGLCHKTLPNMSPWNNETNMFKSNKKRHRKLKIPANWYQKRVF